MNRDDHEFTIGYRAGRADLARKVADELETGAGKGGHIAEIVGRLREIAKEVHTDKPPAIHAQPNCGEALEDTCTCAACNSPIGPNNGCDDEFPELCDDCWFATTS